MAHITRDDVLKLAKLSALAVNEEEISGLAKQIEDVLNYARRVKEIADQDVYASGDYKSQGIYRDDQERPCQADEVLELAPEKAETFFVVPRILEGTE